MNYDDLRECWLRDNEFLENYEHYPELVEEIINNFPQLESEKRRDVVEEINVEIKYLTWIMNNYEDTKLSIIKLFKNHKIDYRKLFTEKS